MYKEFRLVKGSILGRLGENKIWLHSKIAPLNVGRVNNKLVLITV